LERLLREKGLYPSAVRILLHFPPINLKPFLKRYHFFEMVVRWLLPSAGAFIALKAEKK
jgi:hypothetical protein